MGETIQELLKAPLPTLFIIAGMLFLLIAVVGNITGKIEPGEKARIASGILGVIFLATGLTMHLLQKETIKPRSPKNTEQPPKPGPQPYKTEPSKPTPTRADDVPPPKVQTQYPEVVAELTSFKQTGKFITVVLALRNTGSQRSYPWVCPGGREIKMKSIRMEKPLEAKQAKLIDQATGESWEPVNASGSLWSWCDVLKQGHSVGASIAYEIPDPAKKIFSFSLPILNDSFYNLTLDQNPTSTPPSAN